MKTDLSPETVSSPGQSAAAAVNKTAQEARELIDKLAGLADETARKTIPAAAQLAHKTVDNVAAGAAPAAAWLGDRAGDLNLSQERLLNNAREFIRENPLTSIGIALATGILIGRIVR